MQSSDSNAADQPALLAQLVDVSREMRSRPFVKWAGGKSQLLVELTKRMPRSYKRYWEPFIGGGAFFFHVAPPAASISDTNDELIETYKVVRDDVESLIVELSNHRYDKEYYYSVREWDRSENFKDLAAVKRAARFIFLNKTCFNGLHRVNSKGHFNVPFGAYTNPTIVAAENLRNCSRVLQATEISVGDYSSILDSVERGDFVYLDPPYAPLNSTSSFTAYTAQGFGRAEQDALVEFCHRLDKKGVLFMLSNSSRPEMLELYRDFQVESVTATRAINSKGSARGVVAEILVRNY